MLRGLNARHWAISVGTCSLLRRARALLRLPRELQYKNAEHFAICSPFSGNSSPLFRHSSPVSNARLLARTKSARNGFAKRRFPSIASPIYPTNCPSASLLLAVRNTTREQRPFSFRKSFIFFGANAFANKTFFVDLQHQASK